MLLVDVDDSSIQVDSWPKSVWSESQQPLGAVLQSSAELDELWQRLSHDDCTINVVPNILLLKTSSVCQTYIKR